MVKIGSFYIICHLVSISEVKLKLSCARKVFENFRKQFRFSISDDFETKTKDETLMCQKNVPRATNYKYSLLMHRIKIKSAANFFMEWIKRFCGWIYDFWISLTLAILQRQKVYRILVVLPTIQDVGPLGPHAAWCPHRDRWAYTSNFVQYISGF